MSDDNLLLDSAAGEDLCVFCGILDFGFHVLGVLCRSLVLLFVVVVLVAVHVQVVLRLILLPLLAWPFFFLYYCLRWFVSLVLFLAYVFC